jgi:hypothetical protein
VELNYIVVLWAQTSPLSDMLPPCKCFPHVSKMSTLTYNQANKVVIKNALILNIIHYIFNLRDTEVVTSIISVLLKGSNGLNINIKYPVVYKVIVRDNSETIVNSEPTSDYKYHLSGA